MSRRPRARSLRARLLLFLTAALVVVCSAMALTTVLVQRHYLMGGLDDRVDNAVRRSPDGARSHPADLSFPKASGHPDGMLAARLDADGTVASAAIN